MAGNLERLVGIGQTLEPLLSILGKVSGEGGLLGQLRAFVDKHAEEILQAKPLLESQGLVELLGQFLPGTKESEMRAAVKLLMDMAEESLVRGSHTRGVRHE